MIDALHRQIERARLVREQSTEFCRVQFLELGFDPAAAAERALLLYTSALGLVADLEGRPAPPAPEEVRRLVDGLVDLFIAPARPGAREIGSPGGRGRSI